MKNDPWKRITHVPQAFRPFITGLLLGFIVSISLRCGLAIILEFAKFALILGLSILLLLLYRSHPRPRMMQIEIFLVAFLAAVFILYLKFDFDKSLQLLLVFVLTISGIFILLILFMSLVAFYYISYKTIKTCFARLKRISRSDLLGKFLPVLGYFQIVCAIPSCIIYLAVNPQHPKKALQTAVFFLSMGIALIYFLKNKEKFSSVADKVAYFTGAAIGPITVIELLL